MPNEINVEVRVTPLYRKIKKATAQIVVLPGGAGSSKTYSMCQYMLLSRSLKIKNHKLLILRKTRQSNSISIYKQFIELLKDYQIYDERNHNKSSMTYYFPETGGEAVFLGLDERSRIKSTQWHDIVLEEANEFIKEDFIFLKTRLFRGIIEKGFIPRIWLMFNPMDCWIFDYEGKKDVTFIYSTYKDNPFCNKDYIKTLLNLKYEDITYYKIYALGQRASPVGLIYKPYELLEDYPISFDETIFGVDFGFNKPSAILRIDEKDLEFYLTELLYKTKLTNSKLIAEAKELIPLRQRSCSFYADSAEPDRIQEFYDEGFNMYPSNKVVKMGIDFCKRRKFYTKVTNVNLNAERGLYKWQEDKRGDPMDEPVKFRNHLMDCKRYAIYTHYKDRFKELNIKSAAKDIESGTNSEAINTPD